MTMSAAAPEPHALQVARVIAARGWRPFPVDHPSLSVCAGTGKRCQRNREKLGDCPQDKRGKHPVGGWGTMTASEPTDGMLRLWFGTELRNVGIACGRSGLVVLDEDELGSLEKLAESLGEELPVTYRVRTGRAWHWYFDDPTNEFGNAPGALADWHIDVRGGKGDGGYVLAAGSMHWSGHVYEAEDPHVVPAPLPDWIKKLLRSPAAKASSDTDRGKEQRGEWDDRPRYGTADVLRAQYERHVAAVRALAVPEGRRPNGGAFRHALYLAALDGWRLVDCGLIDKISMLHQIRDAVRLVWRADPDDDDRTIVYDDARDKASVSPWVVISPSAPESDAPADDALPPDSFIVPAEVWDLSPELDRIRLAALARQTSPDAVLHSVLAIISSLLHHQTRVHTGKGASVLNYFVAVIGPSGAGKSEALAVARELLADWIDERFAIVGDEGYFEGPIGSGEGLVESFMGTKTVPKLGPDGQEMVNPKTGAAVTEQIRVQVRHNAIFSSDEGRALLAIDSRKGSTAMATLCQLWSGSPVGQTNAEMTRTRRLKGGSYAMAALLGFQPGTVDGLFADELGGAPQRFTFVSAVHPDIVADEVAWPGALRPEVPVSALSVLLPAHLRRQVREHHAARARGEEASGPLDGHRMLIKCRLAVLLALLHGDGEVDDEYWDLAETLVVTSSQLRDYLGGQVERRAKEQARQRRDETVRTQVSAAEEVARATRVRLAADQIVRAIEKAGGQLSRGRAIHALRSDWRNVADQAIQLALADGRLIIEEQVGTITSGSRRAVILRLSPTDEGAQ